MRRNIILAVVVTGVFFGLVEGGLRLSGLVTTDTLRSPDLRTLDSIPGLFQPGQELVDRIRPELPYPIRINSLGFRGEEFEGRKPRGHRRVLCLGDSYTFGHHVTNEQAFPAVMDRILRGETIPTEVINGGANGFTIADEWRFFEEKAVDLEPDIVILQFSQNDILDLARARTMIEGMREHARLKSLILIGPTLKFLQRTATFNAMQRAGAWLRGRRRQSAAQTLQESSDDLWAVYIEHLERMASLTSRRGIEMMLVAWPSVRQIDGTDPPSPNERLAHEAARMGLAFLDLTETMRSTRRTGLEPTLIPLDGHPSPAGHAAAAEAIVSKLRRLGWVDPGGGMEEGA